MKEFWNNMYSSNDYIYGREPNVYYAENLKKLTPGKVLFPGEGEGRNAVYASQLGWDVSAFDSSEKGREKALQLAKTKGVHIYYQVVDADDVVFPEGQFDCIVLIFVHLPTEKRQDFHRKMISYLKPGGHIIFEGFSKKQINHPSGGPKNIDMLFDETELTNDFSPLVNDLNLQFLQTDLDEGAYHRGRAEVVRFTATKKDTA